MTQTTPTTRTIPDPRSPVDRRQRDGLRLLPRATTPEERRRRQQLNRLLGWLMALCGAVILAGSLIGLLHAPEVSVLINALLGALIAAQGRQRISWKDRRKADRRKSRTPAGVA